MSSSLFDKIRASKKGAEPRTALVCDHPGCGKPAGHKAPKGRMHEGEYFNLCLAHVQAYNKNFNYFSGMRDEAIHAYQKESLTGHRPTQPMNVNAKVDAHVREGSNAAEILERIRRARAKPAPKKRTIGNAGRKALDQLGLDETATAELIKQRFKELVKRLHPDANGGDRSMEDRMREVIEAYNYLKQAEFL